MGLRVLDLRDHSVRGEGKINSASFWNQVVLGSAWAWGSPQDGTRVLEELSAKLELYLQSTPCTLFLCTTLGLR